MVKRYIKTFIGDDEDMRPDERAVEFCSDTDFSGRIELPCEAPDIEQVLSIIADPEILSIDIIDTLIGTSAEGEVFTGKKSVVEIRLRYKISYSSKEPGHAVHIIEGEYFLCTYTSIPPIIEGTDPGALVKSRYLKANVEVIDANVRKIENRSLFRHIHLFTKLYLVPAYELCCSQCSETTWGIFICHDNGAKRTQVAGGPGYKSICPLWSPTGRDIAFLSDIEGRLMLYVLNIRDFASKRITAPDVFSSITSYCWCAGGSSIIFASSVEGCKELFSADLYDNKWKQLTFGNSTIKSYKPKCSHDGKWIAFLKSISGITYLYIMDMNSLNCKKASPMPGIKDFSWSCDGRHMACIRSIGGKPDEICVIDITCTHENVLYKCDGVIHKKNIAFSPDGRYIAFIGSDFGTDDVYIYCMEDDSVKNITGSPSNIHVSSIAWKVDGTKIYYSANEMYYYNIYSFSLKDGSRRQLTNTEAGDIELCYRPRIK